LIDTKCRDLSPVVDTWQQTAGLTIGTGMSGHGFGIRPGYGPRFVARLVPERVLGHDLAGSALRGFPMEVHDIGPTFSHNEKDAPPMPHQRTACETHAEITLARPPAHHSRTAIRSSQTAGFVEEKLRSFGITR